MKTSALFDVTTAFPLGATVSTLPGAFVTVLDRALAPASTSINPALVSLPFGVLPR